MTRPVVPMAAGVAAIVAAIGVLSSTGYFTFAADSVVRYVKGITWSSSESRAHEASTTFAR